MKAIIALLFSFCLFSAPTAHAEIFEIQLSIDNMHCAYCARTITDTLRRVPGLDQSRIWAFEGMGLVSWKQNVPFHAVRLTSAFFKTDFLLKQIEIDVEGTIKERKGALMLLSEPDGSLFYIDNPERLAVSSLKEGQLVRLQGVVTNQQGFNFLVVRDVLPPILPE